MQLEFLGFILAAMILLRSDLICTADIERGSLEDHLLISKWTYSGKCAQK